MKKIKHIAIAALALMISASSVFAFVPRTSPQSTVYSLQCGGMNRSTEYLFTSMHRMNRIKYPDNSEAEFSYDNAGNMTYASNQNAEVTYAYDNMSRMIVSTSFVNFAYFVVQNSYDSNGNRTNITYPGGLSVSYEYDEANRLKEVTTKYTNDTKTISFNYDSASRMTNIVYPNGASSYYGYDAESRVISIKHITNGTAFINRAITRDPRGYKTSENYLAGLEPDVIEGEQYTDCNQLDQTVHVEQRDTWFGGELNQWYYKDYSYNPNGALTNLAVTRPSWNTNSTINTYTNNYEWDYDNHLIRVNSTDLWAVKYLYDATGARIARIYNNTTNYFVIDQTDSLKRPLAETDASGNITRYYVWAGYRLLCHVEASTGNITYYHADELGSTLALSDDTGAVTDQYAYMPYGVATHSGNSQTPYQWLGGYGVYYDHTTELHLTTHRAYSSDTRKFISPDPLGIDGGVNVYAYANLNPLFFVDPLGLCADVGEIRAPRYSSNRPYWLNLLTNPGETMMHNFVEHNGGIHNISDADWNRQYKLVEKSKMMTEIAIMTAMGTVSEVPAGVVSRVQRLSAKPLYRYMSQAEANAVKNTGILRGGRAGETFWTDSRFTSAGRVQNRLSLDRIPEVRMEFRLINNPSLQRAGTRVTPKYG